MGIAEFLYTVVLKPRPLRAAANGLIRRLIPAQLHAQGAVVVLNANDPVISGALTFGVYERSETRFFQKLCRAGITFVDIGANVGYYTALALQRIGDGRVVAFEPDPENYGFLERTIAANGASNVVCVKAAAGAKPGRYPLYVSYDNRGDNRMYRNELSTGSCEVEVTTVDATLACLTIDRVDLIKMDVQGFEAEVLAGMQATLRNSPDVVIMTEFWPYGLTSAGSHPEVFLSALEGLGFRFFQLTKRGTVEAVDDRQELIRKFPGRKYGNLIAARGTQLMEV